MAKTFQTGDRVAPRILTAALGEAVALPDPARLTDFYLSMSLGGVIGGAFNVFAAPLIFNAVWEYPIVLGLACLARPWGQGKLGHWRVGLVACAVLIVAALFWPKATGASLVMILLAVGGVVAFLLGPGGRAFSGAPVSMDLGWTAR